VAIDGTKIGSDAALDQNRSESAIRAEVERMVAEAGAADVADHVQSTLDGELPSGCAHPKGRLGRLRAALAEIENERERQRSEQEVKDQRRNEETEAGRRSRGRTPTDLCAALKKAQANLTAAKVTEGPGQCHLYAGQARCH
jgi:hypothetical protein